MPRSERAKARLAAAEGKKQPRTSRPRRYGVGALNLDVRVSVATHSRLNRAVARGERGQFVEEAINEKLDRESDHAA